MVLFFIMYSFTSEKNPKIFGKAMNRILKTDPGFIIESARSLISLRNQIIHGYNSIPDENIWGIVTNYLPKPRTEVENYIKLQ